MGLNKRDQIPFKGRQCGRKLKSDLRKFELFAAFKLFQDCLCPSTLVKGGNLMWIDSLPSGKVQYPAPAMAR